MKYYILIILFLIATFAVLPCISADTHLENEEWSMYRHDSSHTGFSESSAPEHGNPIWSFETGSSITSSPAVADGVVYFVSHEDINDHRLYALDAQTGEEIWSAPLGPWAGFEFPSTIGETLLSSPAVEQGKVYVGSWGGKVFAFDAQSGKRAWSFSIEGGRELRSASLRELLSVYEYFGSINGVYLLQILFIGLGIGLLFLYFKAIGFKLEGFKGMVFLISFFACIVFALAPLSVSISSSAPKYRVDSSPTVENGIVYVGARDNNVYALDAATGEKLWSFETKDIVTSSPAVSDGKVFIGSRDHNLYALDAKTGDTIWAYKTDDLIHSSPAVKNGIVYFGSRDGVIRALNSDNGDVIWGKRVPSLKGAHFINSSPAVAYGKVYFGAYNYNVYALDAENGSLEWKFKTKYRGGYSSPAVADGKVFIGSYGGSYYALDADNGEKIWSFKALGRAHYYGYVVTSPSVFENRVYVASSVFENEGSQLYALGSPIQIEVENMGVYPENMEEGETVTISLNTRNLTDKEGDYVLRLKIAPSRSFYSVWFWPWVKTKDLHFGPNETKSVEFKLSFKVDGLYRVTTPDFPAARWFEVHEKS